MPVTLESCLGLTSSDRIKTSPMSPVSPVSCVSRFEKFSVLKYAYLFSFYNIYIIIKDYIYNNNLKYFRTNGETKKTGDWGDRGDTKSVVVIREGAPY